MVAVDHNVITYQGDIGFSEIKALSPEQLTYSDYTLFTIEHPEVGLV